MTRSRPATPVDFYGPAFAAELRRLFEAARQVQEAAHPEANIIFGAMVDESLEDEVWVTVVATGYEQPRTSRPTLREPAGEPRVTRTREREPVRASRGVDVDVPEFIPRF